MSKYDYDCSYTFSNLKITEEYKYIVVTKGDMDINNVMLLKDKKSIKGYLTQEFQYDENLSNIIGIFEIGKRIQHNIKSETLLEVNLN